jgi:hypothetical protein
MVVKLRFRSGPRVRRQGTKNQRVALAVAALCVPASVAAYVLALWGVGAAMGFTGPFGIGTGLLSHWQVWLGIALGITGLSAWLNDYGSRDKGGLASKGGEGIGAPVPLPPDERGA